MSAGLFLRLALLSVSCPSIPATIEVLHEGTRAGVSTLRCLWTAPPDSAYDPLTLRGSWRRLCDGTSRETILAAFSPTGFVSLHPSVEDGESRDVRGTRGLISVLRTRADCSGTVVCVVDGDGEEGSVAVNERGADAARVSAFKTRGRGMAFRCAPVGNCSEYSVEWLFDGRLLSSSRFSREEKTKAPSNSELTLWTHDRLWVGDSGPWSRSPRGCLTCRIEACGVSDSVKVCGAWQTDGSGPPLAFPSVLWYVVYGLFLVYLVR